MNIVTVLSRAVGLLPIQRIAKRLPRPGFALAVFPVFLACSDSHHSRAPLEYSFDSSGVAIVGSSSASAPLWDIDERPELVIGSIAGDRPSTLHRVESSIQLQDGRIAIAVRGTNEIRYFTSAGEYIKSVGGRGEGPGEFEVITTVRPLAGDSLVVYDIRNRRLTPIGPDMTIVPDAVLATPDITAGRLIDRVGDDRFVMLLLPPLSTAKQGYYRDTLGVAVVRPSRLSIDTLLDVASAERFHRTSISQSGRRTVSRLHPFAHSAITVVWNGMIVTGTGESFELQESDLTGRLRRVLRRTDAATVPLEGEPLEVYLMAVEEAGGSAADTREFLAEFPSPHWLPAFSDAIVDDLGMLWVGAFVSRAGEPEWGREWTVFGPSGRVIARAFTPRGLTPFHITERAIIGVARDSNDVEFVHVLRLLRSSGPE